MKKAAFHVELQSVADKAIAVCGVSDGGKIGGSYLKLLSKMLKGNLFHFLSYVASGSLKFYGNQSVVVIFLFYRSLRSLRLRKTEDILYSWYFRPVCRKAKVKL